MLLKEDNLNTIEVLISMALIDSYISHDEFVSIINVLGEYNEIKEEIKKSWNFCGMQYINMVDIRRKMYERNGIETIVEKNGMLWLNINRTKEGLDQKNLKWITIKYHSDHRKTWTSRWTSRWSKEA